ncbi:MULTISPECIES: phenylalanine--tRNA ligase subunit beta [unclassified Leptolyngbya]|uniref:phenylalanine--tRNA ligase subunit beta n=1 Tax=unclassified Leptolyngbya TaxID=2650499 RepID=UPI0016872927|nr:MULTISPECIES: phenylalanine--tRNA ligase subunit beta [unclassified Leptolyngbya]MBD1912511.1 phenylalanine--tRNA ligase subunit beta [Leptolyngbya sp. FACHB-8]MBD2156478.1 phenylalanine--tRNA ligase subunit beta [Leptolyngbya sp. FACHB-16]
MRISLNWLRELVDISMTPQELAEALTMAGFEVEDIEDRRTWADGVVVGRVLAREQHPNADRLSVCQVDIGAAEPSTIVCGAANVRADIYVPVATVGTYLPTIDLKIRPRKLRDVPSAGMICSLAELGLAKESDGIHIFPQETLTPGQDVRPLLGLDDVILDLTSTANRADALSLVGIAREIAAITGATLKLPEIPATPLPEAGNDLVLKIEDTKACPIYIGTLISGVTIAPSPEWLQRRLLASGTRPINNVVDITNYVLLEWGQPLHAFDADRLRAIANTQNLTIGVRTAHAGESLTTLDSQSRTLTDQTLLITAGDRPVALAGVMGGEDSEVHSGSVNLMLEAAFFDSVAIRRSARSQGLRTEASARYERGVNPAELLLACRRALALISELAGGTPDSQAIADATAGQASTTRTIELRLERVNAVLGPVELGDPDEGDSVIGELQAEDVERTLTALGCQLTPITPDRTIWTVTVPPYRYRDLEREIDLVEEVARLYGFNKFVDTLPKETEPGYLPVDQELTRAVHQALRAVGLTEVVHYSVGKPDGDSQVVLTNPLFAEYSALRPDLLQGLIDAFQYNLEQGNGPLNAYEIGRVFWQDEDGLMEADRVAGILGGDASQGRWVRSGREQPMTWYEAKGVLESVFRRLGVEVEYQPDRRNPLLHPGRTASLWVGGELLGRFGQLHPQVRQERGLPDEVYAFELELDQLLNQMDQETNLTPVFQTYSSFPATDRDIAFFAPTQFSVAEIERAVEQVGKPLLESVELFDEYRGDKVPAGQHSLAFRLIYRAGDRTLTDEDVEPIHQKVREVLEEKFQANLRS